MPATIAFGQSDIAPVPADAARAKALGHIRFRVEWLFDPRGLAMELVNRGFSARAIPHYGGASNDLLLTANRVLRWLPSFRFARAFRIVAQRN